jgi:putative ABC transport system permease protein
MLVAAIALVIAIGTGMQTGLGSMETWRKQSNDASYALLHAHDVKVELAEGSFAEKGRLLAVLRQFEEAGSVRLAEERLVVPTRVATGAGEDEELVAGELVGVDVAAPGPRVDGVAARDGRSLRSGDAGRPRAVLERGFAREHDLPATGELRLGGTSLRYVGTGTSPEYFLVARPGGGEFGASEATFAVVFAPLDTAQRVSGREGRVNRLILTLREGTDAEAFGERLEHELQRRAPELGATATTLADDQAHRVLYKDAEGDQRTYDIFAFLILGGAALAAFNLASRVVEAQRREIGIGMAIGVSPRELALRPLLLGAEIALLGALLGVILGRLFQIPLESALRDLLPLPRTVTPFETGVFLRGAVLGFLIPLLAVAWPVWRAVRVQPVEAIRVGFRSAKGGGLAPLAARLRLPGRSLAQLPLRNILRAPRRSLMTALGIAAVITVLVGLFGLIDSFLATIDRSEAEAAGSNPARMAVSFDRFYPLGSEQIRGVADAPEVARADPRITVPARLGADSRSFEVVLNMVDAESSLWHPTAVTGRFDRGSPGVLISEEAAHDLGVDVGDAVVLEHPRRTGPTSSEVLRTRLPVVGLHPDPFRTSIYMDASRAGLLGLAGMANALSVLPAEGVSQAEARRALFDKPGVTAAEGVTAVTEALDRRMDDFIAVLRVVQAVGLALALLIAFNSTSISADERAREHATMAAFGLPLRTVLRMSVVEGLLTGVVATLVGVGLGLAVVGWIVNNTTADTLPELGVEVTLSAGTAVTAALLGIVAVGLAPLLTVRRLRRMDVPSTLRVVE